jgi:hypothetical protein
MLGTTGTFFVDRGPYKQSPKPVSRRKGSTICLARRRRTKEGARQRLTPTLRFHRPPRAQNMRSWGRNRVLLAFPTLTTVAAISAHARSHQLLGDREKGTAYLVLPKAHLSSLLTFDEELTSVRGDNVYLAKTDSKAVAFIILAN